MGATAVTIIEPVGIAQVLFAIDQISNEVAAGGAGLLAGGGSFADALAAAAEQAMASPGEPAAAVATATPAAPVGASTSAFLALGSGAASPQTRPSSPAAPHISWPTTTRADLHGIPKGTGILPAPADLQGAFSAATAAYGLPPGLLEAVATEESGMNPNAVSPAGAEGLMQIMPATAASNSIANPFNPTEAIFGAARILAGNIAQFHSLPLALAAYNAGAGAVEQYGGIPPYTETENYVANIMAMIGGAS